jgi:CBS domain-containing protein
MIIRSVGEAVEGRVLSTIAPDATVRTASAALAHADSGALAVMDGDRLVGILCEHDVVARVVAAGRRSDETQVRDVMSPDPETIDADESLVHALAVMQRSRHRHLPVTEGGRPVAMLSYRDVPTEYRFLAEQFEEMRTPLKP